MVVEHKDKIKREKQEAEQAVAKHQACMKRKDEEIQDLLS